MARVPIIRVGETLIATVLEDLHDRDALQLQEDLGHALERTGARGVLLDLSVVELIDSFLGRLLNDIAAGTRLLGAQTVIVGMQPAVAITLVELGLELSGVHTALNAERGMAVLRRLVAGEARRGGDRRASAAGDRAGARVARSVDGAARGQAR
jgi:rsbT antagonist protein RsbS